MGLARAARALMLVQAVWLPLLALSDAATAERRLALVVGNGGYAAENATPLDNPVNDARLIAGALETVGFEVRLVADVDRAALVEEIDGFGERLERAGSDAVGLFYYAGHGVEARGRNYLIPLGARIGREQHLRTRAVSAELVLSWMEEAGNGLNIVVLDACRDNPYGARNRGGARGLAPMDAPSGSVIAYAAGPGEAAKDGDGENSPYTAALARALVQPGLKIRGRLQAGAAGSRRRDRRAADAVGEHVAVRGLPFRAAGRHRTRRSGPDSGRRRGTHGDREAGSGPRVLGVREGQRQRG